MSGGSWDYLTFKIDEAGVRLEQQKSPLRRAFGQHMRLVAKAMYDIEWVDSCDKSPGDEVEAIKDVLRDSCTEKQIAILIDDAKEVIRQLKSFGA